MATITTLKEALDPLADEAHRYDCPRCGSGPLPDETEVKVPLGALRRAAEARRTLETPPPPFAYFVVYVRGGHAFVKEGETFPPTADGYTIHALYERPLL